jgi:hypothetical protein
LFTTIDDGGGERSRAGGEGGDPKRSADIAVPVVAGVLGRRSVVAALVRIGSPRNGWRAWYATSCWYTVKRFRVPFLSVGEMNY